MKPYVIKTQRLCVYLQNKGCHFIKPVRDRLNPKYFIYLFEDNEKLRRALEEFKPYEKDK
jgi:hypothetical protein